MAIKQGFVVDFIGKNNQAMFARQLNHTQQHLVTVQSPCRVVGVDDDNAARVVGNFAGHIGQIWGPLIGLITDVMHGGATRQRH